MASVEQWPVVTDQDGRRWRVEPVSHGRTSVYLNPRVHRPIVQFTCLESRVARRYAPLPAPAASPRDLGEDELAALLMQARPH
jgi:hypothetical protein